MSPLTSLAGSQEGIQLVKHLHLAPAVLNSFQTDISESLEDFN